MLILLGVATIGANLWHIFFTEDVFIGGCIGLILVGILLIIGGWSNLNGNVSWDD